MWKRRSRVARPAIVASLLVAGATAIAGNVADEVLFPGESVKFTLGTTGDRKSVAIAGIGGTRLDVNVSGTRGTKVVPRLTMLAPDGTLADLGAPASGKHA